MAIEDDDDEGGEDETKPHSKKIWKGVLRLESVSGRSVCVCEREREGGIEAEALGAGSRVGGDGGC